MHSSNSTIAANFEQDIPELIENQLSVSLDRVQGYPHYVKFIVTSDYPITSPITITYQVQGEFYVDKQDEWGGAQPPTESFQSRDWTRTLNVGQSVWEFKEQPDVYVMCKDHTKDSENNRKCRPNANICWNIHLLFSSNHPT